jgi:hypothetical protein
MAKTVKPSEVDAGCEAEGSTGDAFGSEELDRISTFWIPRRHPNKFKSQNESPEGSQRGSPVAASIVALRSRSATRASLGCPG